MEEDNYSTLLKLVIPLIEKQDTPMRSISAHERLWVTLQYLATGRNYEDLKFSTLISPAVIMSDNSTDSFVAFLSTSWGFSNKILFRFIYFFDTVDRSTDTQHSMVFCLKDSQYFWYFHKLNLTPKISRFDNPRLHNTKN